MIDYIKEQVLHFLSKNSADLDDISDEIDIYEFLSAKKFIESVQEFIDHYKDNHGILIV
jgi:hypothetical protein